MASIPTMRYSSSPEFSMHSLRALGEDSSDSGFDDLGFVDLSFCENIDEFEQDHAMPCHCQSDFESATLTRLDDLDETLHRSIDSIRIENIREYRAWVGSRSLHIS